MFNLEQIDWVELENVFRFPIRAGLYTVGVKFDFTVIIVVSGHYASWSGGSYGRF